MGCHTWFYRPVTKEEREKLRLTAIEKANELLVEDSDQYLKNRIIDSVNKDTDFWIENGWYTYSDYIEKINGKLYVEVSSRDLEIKNGELFACQISEYFHDNFRVYNYPSWVIHNRRELRRKMKKKYFKLTNDQLEDISRFFRMYRGGVIIFG